MVDSIKFSHNDISSQFDERDANEISIRIWNLFRLELGAHWATGHRDTHTMDYMEIVLDIPFQHARFITCVHDETKSVGTIAQHADDVDNNEYLFRSLANIKRTFDIPN